MGKTGSGHDPGFNSALKSSGFFSHFRRQRKNSRSNISARWQRGATPMRKAKKPATSKPRKELTADEVQERRAEAFFNMEEPLRNCSDRAERSLASCKQILSRQTLRLFSYSTASSFTVPLATSPWCPDDPRQACPAGEPCDGAAQPRRLGSDGPANVAGFVNVVSMLRCHGRGPYGQPCSQNNQTHHTKSGLWLRSRRNRISPTSSSGPAPASPHEPSRNSGKQKSLLS